MIDRPVSIVSAALDCGKYSHILKGLHISLPRCTLFYQQTGEIALQRPNLFILCSLSLVASVPKSRTTSMLSDGRLNGTRQRRSEQRSTDGTVEHSPKSCFCWNNPGTFLANKTSFPFISLRKTYIFRSRKDHSAKLARCFSNTYRQNVFKLLLGTNKYTVINGSLEGLSQVNVCVAFAHV